MRRFVALAVTALMLLLASLVSAVEPEMVTIPGTDYEANGPTYTYQIGKYEITNTDYCEFLNNAELIQQTTPDDPRCTNMWFSPATGDVYMTNTTDSTRRLYWTTRVPESKINYNPAQPPGSRFHVQTGYEGHPVGTVSWAGAAKFCNWLTIDRGLDVSDICYHEGATRDDWYPITASDWPSNGLLESERLDLVRNCRGYRLPMDGVNGGSGWSHYWNMDANTYNEWYKAAAFDPAAPDTARNGPGTDEVVQPYHWIFGYGSDINTNADANLVNSGDPFGETTPVGWYNGVSQLVDGTLTNDTRNQYGLYDMCGNVAEWISDTDLAHPWDSTYRATRGGRWVSDDAMYAVNSVRHTVISSYCAENNIGLRLARSPGYADFDADGDVDHNDYAFFADAMTGPVATVATGFGHEGCDYDGDSHVDLRDFVVFQARFSAGP